uniref:Uncharacterized protein n=1 Tax=Strigamia maritima TaxID=126957 RepID=T1IYD8_STRMM
MTAYILLKQLISLIKNDAEFCRNSTPRKKMYNNQTSIWTRTTVSLSAYRSRYVTYKFRSSFQDVALDTLALTILSDSELGQGNSAQVNG